MICPSCGHDNVPGNEECDRCQQALTSLDTPSPADAVERSLMEDPVSALCPRAPITIRPTASVRDALQAMLAHNVGALVVVDDHDKLLGILSERDLLKKVAGQADPYADRRVAEVMTRNPVSVTPDAKLNYALHMMDSGGYRHLPVVTDGQPTGVISVRDMMRHLTQLCKK